MCELAVVLGADKEFLADHAVLTHTVADESGVLESIKARFAG